MSATFIKLRFIINIIISYILSFASNIKRYIYSISFVEQYQKGECIHISITTLNGNQYNYLVHKRYTREFQIFGEDDIISLNKIDNTLHITPRQLGLTGVCTIHINRDHKFDIKNDETIDK